MDYLTIPEEIRDLELSSTERIVLSVIYSFSREGQGSYYGTLAYIANWSGSTVRTVRATLRKLEDLGLIERGERTRNGITTGEYTLGKNFLPPRKNFPATPEKISSNNKRDNKDINISTLSISDDERVFALQSRFNEELDAYKGRYSEALLMAFERYWAAPLQHPTAKQRKEGIFLLYQEQKTWDLSRRLATWKARDDERNSVIHAKTFGPRVNDRGETATVASLRASRESLEGAGRLQALRVEDEYLKLSDR